MDLFEAMAQWFEQTTVTLYSQYTNVPFICLDLIWQSIGEKVPVYIWIQMIFFLNIVIYNNCEFHYQGQGT